MIIDDEELKNQSVLPIDLFVQIPRKIKCGIINKLPVPLV